MGSYTLSSFVLFLTFAQFINSSPYLTTHDRDWLKSVLESAKPYQDLQSVYYSVLGLKLLGQTITNAQEICNFAKTKLDAGNVESLYYASGIVKAITNCQISFPTSAEKVLNGAVTDETSVQDLYYITFALKNIGYKVDSTKISKVLNTALKKEDSALNLGYAFHMGTVLSDSNPLFERIEDAIVQADEVNGKFAQFEGGLSITAVVISGIYKLADRVKKAPALDADKCTKFANYFMSRKRVQVIRAAYYLLDVINILANNKYHIPIVVSLASKTAVSTTDPVVQVRITNLLGAALGTLKVTMDKAVNALGEVVVKETPLLEVKSDKTLYEFNFMQSKPSSGFYKLHISATPSASETRLVGNKDAIVEVKVMTQISVEALEVGTIDVDQTTTPKMHKVQHPSKLADILEIDYHQKLQMKFNLKDKIANKNMLAHQVFVRLVNLKTKQEITFVAEPDSTKIYRFDLDINSKAKELGYLSGRYQLDLIVGDAVVANPFMWYICDLDLTFPDGVGEVRSDENQYAPKPEIKHIFRQPEKRPSTVVSNSFTVLALAPLLLLVVLWIRIGINLSNFSFDIGTIGFHLGLAAIFCLFIVFWLQLNMFTTLKYLTLIGTFTFLCGHRMLSRIAASKK